MTATTVHVAVIEWGGGEEPSVYVSHTWMDVAQAAARSVGDPDSEAPSDWPEVREELPLTPEVLADADALDAWHRQFRDGITVPWVTFYEKSLAP